MMKRYKLLLALALSLLVFWPLGSIKADTANQPPESANQYEQASAAVVTDSSDSSAGARALQVRMVRLLQKLCRSLMLRQLQLLKLLLQAKLPMQKIRWIILPNQRQLSLQKFPLLPIKRRVR